MSIDSLKAEAIFRGEGLDCPRIEPGQDLLHVSPGVFATRAGLWDVYAFESWIESWAIERTPYRAFGFAGHGLMSFAVHFYAFTDDSAFALQLRWGGVFTDPNEVRRRYDAMLKMADVLDDKVRALKASGDIEPQLRVAVAHSDFHGARWAWLDPQAGDIDWQWHQHAVLGAMAALSRQRTTAESAR